MKLPIPSVPSTDAVAKGVVITAISLALITVAINFMPATWQTKARNALGLA